MIVIDKTSTVPLYQQVYTSAVKEIENGTLGAGQRLPATRKLAETLGVGRNTIIAAYDQLLAEGFVSAHVGSGYTVNKLGPMESQTIGPAVLENTNPKEDNDVDFDFAHGQPIASFFPCKEWRKSLDVAFDGIIAQDGRLREDPQGQWDLRETLRSYLKRSRNVECETSQIIITSGFNYTLNRIAELLKGEFTSLITEDPVLDSVYNTFRHHGYSIESLPMEEDGIALEGLDSLDSRLLYVTPTHHFLTGALLSSEKRERIMDWAEEHDGYIIEDDYTVDLRTLSLATPALQSCDTHNRVIYTGTFSKSISTGVRAAFMVLPQTLLPHYQECFSGFDLAASITDQLTLADFIANGQYDRQLRTMMTYNERRREALVGAVSYVLGARATVVGSGPGEHVLLDVHSPFKQDELVRRAANVGVRVCTTDQYYFAKTGDIESQVLLGFGTVEVESYVDALQRLKKAWFENEEN